MYLISQEFENVSMRLRTDYGRFEAEKLYKSATGETTTALHVACQNLAPLSIINTLVTFNEAALVTYSTAFGRKRYLPLHVACRKNSSPEVVEALCFACPSSMEARAGSNLLPVDIAQQHGASEGVIEILVRGAEYYRFQDYNIFRTRAATVDYDARHKTFFLENQYPTEYNYNRRRIVSNDYTEIKGVRTSLKPQSKPFSLGVVHPGHGTTEDERSAGLGYPTEYNRRRIVSHDYTILMDNRTKIYGAKSLQNECNNGSATLGTLGCAPVESPTNQSAVPTLENVTLSGSHSFHDDSTCSTLSDTVQNNANESSSHESDEKNGARFIVPEVVEIPVIHEKNDETDLSLGVIDKARNESQYLERVFVLLVALAVLICAMLWRSPAFSCSLLMSRVLQ